MALDPLEVPATPARIRRLAAQAQFDGHVLGRALVHAQIVPERAAWARFIDGTLLLLAIALTLSGIIFFFAYNWADMHRFVKFGLIEVAIVIAVGMAARWGRDRLIGKLALLFAAILVGALLAVFGQAYQTGADSFQLFLAWTVLVLPWVVIARWVPLWSLLLVLLNTSFVLFCTQRINTSLSDLFEVLALANALWLAAWETLQRRGVEWARGRWFPQLVALWTLIMLTTAMIEWIWDGTNDLASAATPLLYVSLGGLLLYVSRAQHDLLILTMAAFSMIVVLTAAAAQLVGDSFGSYIVLSGLVIFQAFAAVHLLRRAQRAWERGI